MRCRDIKKVMVIGLNYRHWTGRGIRLRGHAGVPGVARRGLIEVVLVNSNPKFTIMTDADIADKVYIEPCAPKRCGTSSRRNAPIAPAHIGRQTGLNPLWSSELAFEVWVRLLYRAASIKMAEDPQEFKDAMLALGEPCIASSVVNCRRWILPKRSATPVIVRLGPHAGRYGRR